MCKTPVVSCCEEQSIALSLLYLLSLPQINQSQDWSVPDWDTLKWGNWVADWSTKAQNLSAQKGSASVGDNLQLERKQLLLTEGWVKMRLSNHDKENCWQFLASSAYPCKECTSREAGPARSMAQGGRVGQSLGCPRWAGPAVGSAGPSPAGPSQAGHGPLSPPVPQGSPMCPQCSAGLSKALLSSKYSYSNNKSVFIISALVSKLHLWYLHSIYLNFIGVFSWEIGFHFHS